MTLLSAIRERKINTGVADRISAFLLPHIKIGYLAGRGKPGPSALTEAEEKEQVDIFKASGLTCYGKTKIEVISSHKPNRKVGCMTILWWWRVRAVNILYAMVGIG